MSNDTVVSLGAPARVSSIHILLAARGSAGAGGRPTYDRRAIVPSHRARP